MHFDDVKLLWEDLTDYLSATCLFHKWNTYTIRHIYEVYSQNILQAGINFLKICRTEGDSEANFCTFLKYIDMEQRFCLVGFKLLI